MRAKKIDANQNDVVKSLRQIPGVTVAITSALGNGFVDLVVGWKGLNFLIELKDEKKPPSARKLTGDEEKFMASWRGQYAVCNNLTEILVAIGLRSEPKNRLINI